MRLFPSQYLEIRENLDQLTNRLTAKINETQEEKKPCETLKLKFTKNQFQCWSARLPRNIIVKGNIQKLSEKRLEIHLDPKIIWYRLLINGGLFLGITFFLILLPFLLMKEHFLEGTCALICSSVLIYLLFKHLLGNLQKNFQIQCDLILSAIKNGNTAVL